MQPKRFSTKELFLMPNNFIDFADLSGSMGLGPLQGKGFYYWPLWLFPQVISYRNGRTYNVCRDTYWCKRRAQSVLVNTFKTYSFALGPFFERFFVFSWPGAMKCKRMTIMKYSPCSMMLTAHEPTSIHNRPESRSSFLSLSLQQN